MINEIIKDMPMDSNYESEWIPLEIKLFDNKGKRRANSLQIAWDNVIGTLDGTIEVYARSDVVSGALGRMININSASNLSDSELLILYPALESIKFIYNANGITGGTLNIALSY
jgi:hypothetical protein